MDAKWPSSQSRRNKWWRCTAGKRRERGREAKDLMTTTPQMLSWPSTPERWEPSGISFLKKLSLSSFPLSFVFVFCLHSGSQVSAPKPTSFCIFYENLARALKSKKRTAACRIFFFFFFRGFFWKFNFRGWKKRAAICLIKNLAWPNPAQCEGKD